MSHGERWISRILIVCRILQSGKNIFDLFQFVLVVALKLAIVIDAGVPGQLLRQGEAKRGCILDRVIIGDNLEVLSQIEEKTAKFFYDLIARELVGGDKRQRFFTQR
jgi:hypothetical protein